MGKVRPYEECHRIIDNTEQKLCSDCNEWFPMTVECFYENKSSKSDGFNPYCKKCAIKRSKQRNEENIEHVKKYRKMEYRKNEQYYKNKATRWNKENEVRAKELQREWQKSNPEKISEYNKERQMHKTHTITKDEWENCKNYFNYRCAYCSLPIEEHYINFKGETRLGDFHKEHVDHEGGNDLSNCIPSCKSCNVSKHTYTLNEWYNENNKIFTTENLNNILLWLELDYKLYLETN